jgi:hypothetical protein
MKIKKLRRVRTRDNAKDAASQGTTKCGASPENAQGVISELMRVDRQVAQSFRRLESIEYL